MTNNCDGIIEQTFAEYANVEELVDVNLLENANHCNRIHRRDQCGEEEQVDRRRTAMEVVAQGVQRHPSGRRVPDGANDCVGCDCANVAEKLTMSEFYLQTIDNYTSLLGMK